MDLEYRIIWAGLACLLIVGGDAAPARANSAGGFRTARPSMLTQGARDDVSFTPLLTVGDTLPSGYRFESIPDGIALRRHGRNFEVYLNHETSTVPFPFVAAAPTAANGESDFDNAQLSLLLLNPSTVGVLQGILKIRSTEKYQRFCSSYLAGANEGFSRELLFTNEEAVEWVNTTGDAWPSGQGVTGARQSGAVVAVDISTGARKIIWGMGRLNHENTLAIPGFSERVLLSGDDPFLTNPAQSQLYAYFAQDANAVWNDQGSLWAFVSDTPGFDDYYDFAPSSTATITGHFVAVPRNIATGRLNGTGRELLAADVGYPAPAPGDFAADSFGLATDGPQWVLEHWSDLNGVFQFVRLEDMAYDKRPGMANVVYLVDSGRGLAGAPQAGRSTNGRIWKMVLDPADPRHVLSLSIFVDGDDSPVRAAAEIHQPDNIESTPNSLLITEDPGGSQQFPIGSLDPDATTARLWRVPLDAPNAAEVVARVDQSADGGPTDVDGRPPANLGAWEPSGVVDASAAFGAGAFLITVQAPSLWIESAPGPDRNGDGNSDFTFKRSGGQLILVNIPGA